MGNFAGYIYSDEERAAQNVFCNAMLCGEYKHAERTIRSVYKRWKLEPDGRDNWFCYDLADRIVRYAGKEPQIMYEN